ncbi:MAG: formylglycine-generating enzyme family protein [Methylococcaceae bacterium]
MSDTPGGILQEIKPGHYRIEHPLAINPKDGTVLVYVPAGTFEMGDGKDTDCPKHPVELSAYWIGVACVTNAQYLKFVQETGHRPPDQSDYSSYPPVWKGKHYPPEKARHPVVCVSWDDAQAYARWAGCQLPSEAQWEKAVRGPKGLIYPWGPEWSPDKCRHDKNRGNETTAPTYGYPQGASGYGTYNQSGNVWEWCEDWYAETYYQNSPPRDPTGPASGSSRVSRGGSWWRVDPDRFRAAYRLRFVPDYRLGRRGFRLVRSA